MFIPIWFLELLEMFESKRRTPRRWDTGGTRARRAKTEHEIHALVSVLVHAVD